MCDEGICRVKRESVGAYFFKAKLQIGGWEHQAAVVLALVAGEPFVSSTTSAPSPIFSGGVAALVAASPCPSTLSSASSTILPPSSEDAEPFPFEASAAGFEANMPPVSSTLVRQPADLRRE